MDAEDILVSVIIPTYSRNDSLLRAISSVVTQTHKNIEILIIDDNPSDSPFRAKTEKLMEQYKEDTRVRYIQNEVNLGGAEARNVGIRKAEGDYIAFLDDDDIYYPDKIEKQLEVFLTTKMKKLALVYCYYEHIDSNENVFYTCRVNERGNCLYESIKHDCIAPTSLWLAKKDALIDVGGFTKVPTKQDSTVLLKLLSKGYEFDLVEKVLSKYNNVPGAECISHNWAKSIQGELIYRDACRKAYVNMSKKQIKHIEYEFQKRLYNKSAIIANTSKEYSDMMKEQETLMYKAFPLETLYYITRRKLSKVKRQIMRTIKHN